jgi:hypothetical protein
MPAFVPGTFIATATGERRIEDLTVGDKVVTRDHGIQPVRWVGKAVYSWDQLRDARHLSPVLVQEDALGSGYPERDTALSPDHRIVMEDPNVPLEDGTAEQLVSAKALVNSRNVHIVDAMGISYVLVLFDGHEMVLANGMWCECYQPADLDGSVGGTEQCVEIEELFPDFAEDYLARQSAIPNPSYRLVFSADDRD